MNFLRVLGFLAAASFVLPCAALAQEAYTSKTVHLRAGPAREYPVVAIVAPGVRLLVQGCLGDYSWCDVVLPDGNRGWVYAGNIVAAYQGGNVPLLTYGSTIGIGIVAFSLGAYWDNHYRGRPWYRDRPRWIDRRAPPRPPITHAPGAPRPLPAPVQPRPRTHDGDGGRHHPGGRP